MSKTLDLAPLRSFVTVADAGGFQRAGDVLHLSQGAVSQHVRRLEAAIARPLVERRGRGWRFSADGEELLSHARRILALHDEVLDGYSEKATAMVVIGSTEHAASRLIPYLAASLEKSLPGYRIRFRIDRGTELRESFAAGRLTPVVARHVVTALRRVLTASGVADFAPHGYVLAEGAR